MGNSYPPCVRCGTLPGVMAFAGGLCKPCYNVDMDARVASLDTRRTVAQVEVDELAAAAWGEIRRTLFRDVPDAGERERLALRYAMRINEAITAASWDEPTIAELAAWGWGKPDA